VFQAINLSSEMMFSLVVVVFLLSSLQMVLSTEQSIQSNISGMCMYGNLIVTPSSVQAAGSHVYAEKNGEYKEVAFLRPDLMTTACAVSENFIVLAVFSQSPVDTLYEAKMELNVFERQNGEFDWKHYDFEPSRFIWNVANVNFYF